MKTILLCFTFVFALAAQAESTPESLDSRIESCKNAGFDLSDYMRLSDRGFSERLSDGTPDIGAISDISDLTREQLEGFKESGTLVKPEMTQAQRDCAIFAEGLLLF